LRYAQELNRPILPVQIGPLDSMRVNPLASVQAIDYQNPSIESGIELIAAVHARKANAEPLPSPLPEPPPVPFAYLMRLDTAIAAPELTAAEQAQLFSDLKYGLDTNTAPPRKSRKRWIIAGAALAAVAAAVTVVILIIPTQHPPPKPPPKITAGQLNSILLPAARINTIMCASHMQPGDVLQKMANESSSVVPANCIGALF